MQIYPFFVHRAFVLGGKTYDEKLHFLVVVYSVDHISNFLVNTSSTWANPVSQSSDMNSSPSTLAYAGGFRLDSNVCAVRRERRFCPSPLRIPGLWKRDPEW